MIKISRVLFATMLVVTLVSSAPSAFAAPVVIGSGDFSGSETLIDFNTIGNEVQINNQFTASGATFSGALFGMTNSGDTSLFPANGGGVIASNWLYSQDAHQGLSFTVQFASLMNRVGFYLENWNNQIGTVEIFNGAASLGSIAFTTASLTAEFKAFEDLTGFDRVVFTNTDATNGFFAIDDFRFETAQQTVPEPGTLLLMGAALAGWGIRRRR